MEKTIFDFLLNGAEKKKYVMDTLKEYLEDEIYERYSPIFDLTIDGIIYLAKNKKVLGGLITKTRCF
jgi:hypothetical protein